MNWKKWRLLALILFSFLTINAQVIPVQFTASKNAFPLAGSTNASIYFDASAPALIGIAARALETDVYDITGKHLSINPAEKPKGNIVLIGTIGQSKYIDQLIKEKKLKVDQVANQWEAYTIQTIIAPFPDVPQALVIAGADRRGTAFGVFELSRQMGVSPWKWWADVAPEKQQQIFIGKTTFFQSSPKIKYRGIFINDEDWGMQPWAAKNMDTAVHDIGPNAYAHLFELLLRLRANYLWPAMHPCTKAFYYYPDNPRLANNYGIVVGSSHCEPMLRNNVFEWAENYEQEYGKKPGEWRYDLNKNEIYQYWKDRVVQSKNYESVYTVGMRGIHDGSMPGPKVMPEKVQLLQNIITDQRSLLQTTMARPARDMAQIFCPYKEVLDVYRHGVQLPDDVTIVWADDNHGYMRQLSNEAEQKRSGGSGIYYHLSYWGSPHDYLWLSSQSPSLIAYEMSRAYDCGANRLWVFNVGDVKPAEMEIEYAMDLAWDIDRMSVEKAAGYAETWARRTFGAAYAQKIAAIKKIYFGLAAAAKPEHMGSVSFSPEATSKRLEAYHMLAKMAEELKAVMPARLQDAYFELIYYPVMGAMLMNEKILLAQKSFDPTFASTALQNAEQAMSAFEQIKTLTETYNTKIAGGKWNGIMSWHPRNLPVFYLPKLATRAYLDSMKTQQQMPVIGTENGQTPDLKTFNKAQLYPGQYMTMVEGLGCTGSALTILPVDASFNFKTKISEAPYASFALDLAPGTYTISLKCLPAQSISGDKKLLYGISLNKGPIETVNVHAEAESRQWKENVLRGYAEGKSKITIIQKNNQLRIYFPQSGLAISEIKIVAD